MLSQEERGLLIKIYEKTHSEYNPDNGTISVIISNFGDSVWKEMRKIRNDLYVHIIQKELKRC